MLKAGCPLVIFVLEFGNWLSNAIVIVLCADTMSRYSSILTYS